jgi:PKD repeat protein
MRRLLFVGLVVASFAFAAQAGAATVQIGETAAPDSPAGSCGGCTFFQSSWDPAGPSYAVPAGDGGVITSWSAAGPPSSVACTGSACDAGLLVERPAGGGEYALVGQSTTEALTPNGTIQSFPTNIVVDPGDVIGLLYSDTPPFVASPDSDDMISSVCSFTIGTPCVPGFTEEDLMNILATVTTPTAAFTPSATSVLDGTAVNLNGAASTSAGTITDYSWNFGDGTTLDSGGTATATHTYTTSGAHTVTLTITDSNDDTNETSHTVTATAPQPTARFTPSETSVMDGASISFDGSASTSAGTITDYSWNFGDGSALDSHTAATATHSYTAPGAYTVTLTVTNSYGGTNQTSSTVTADAPPFLGSSLASTAVSASAKGNAKIDVACSPTAVTSCEDSVGLYSTAGKLPAALSARAKPAKRLGSASFSLTSGGTSMEDVTLNAAGRALLARKRFAARAVISASDGAGRTFTTTTAVTVKLVAKHPRHATLALWPLLAMPAFTA